MFRKPRVQASFDIAVVTKTADRDPRNFGDCAQLHHKIDAASVRQSNIADEQIELIARCRFHGRADIVSRRNEMPAADKQFLQSSARVVVIVDEQNFQALLRNFTSYFSGDRGYFSRRKRCQREDECLSAIASAALRGESAAVRLGEGF